MIATPDGASEYEVHLWNANDGEKLKTLNTGFAHVLMPLTLDFSSSGKYLLTTRQVWDVKTGKRLWECPEQDHAVGPTNYLNFRAGTFFDDEEHVVICQDSQYQIWNWRKNIKRATIYIIPHGNWAMVNHETGHWNGSNLAFQYLRFLHKDKAGREHWLTSYELEKQTGWVNDPLQAGLDLSAESSVATGSP